MKTSILEPTMSITAAAALSAHYFVGLDGNVCGSGAKALGVTLADCASGSQASLQIRGVAVVLSGAAISAVGPVKSDSAGKAIPAVTFAAAAPAVTYDSSKLTIGANKLTIDSGVTPVTSSAANGDIVTAAADAMAAASGFVALAAPALTGSVLPEVINGYAIDTAGGANEYVRVLLV